MKLLRAWLVRFSGPLTRTRREQDFNDEIESHINMHAADNLRAGMSADEARRNAVLKLGGIEQVKEAYRERSTAPFFEHLLLDFRFALRQLRGSPGFTAAAVLVMAIALCGNLATFAFVDAALIKPLPYPQPSRLVAVTEGNALFPRANLSYLDYLDWKASNGVFSSFSVSHGNGLLLKTESALEPAPAALVSPDFFRTLGVHTILGRDFNSNEGNTGSEKAVVLTHRSWQQHFAGTTSIIGKRIDLSGETYTVIGVLPETFQFAPRGPAEFWTTIDPKNPCASRRSCHNLDGIARLKNGVSAQEALAEMTAVSKRLERVYPDSNRGQWASVVPLTDALARDLRPLLIILMCGASLLLAIAGLNVASLLLARSERRRREMALRSALGASTMRLMTQFSTESFLLVAGAVALALLLAHWVTQAFEHLIPPDMLDYMPFLLHVNLNARVLGFAAALSTLAVVLFSIMPGIHFRASKVQDGLSEGSRGSSGKGWRRLGARLVVIELAVAMVLLVGAGLCSKSFHRLMEVDLGFEPDHLATIDVAAPDNQSFPDNKARALARELVRTVGLLPGVKAAALTTLLPVTFNGNTDWIRIVGKPYDGNHIEVNDRDVSSEYFRTIRATLLRGRYFTDDEDETKPKVIVINETFARKYFPGENPIGQQIGDIVLSPKSIKTIIGVVRDIRDGALDSEIWPTEFHPFNQDPSSYFSVIALISQKPESILPQLRSAIKQTRSDIGMRNETTMQALINNSMTAYIHRSSAWLVSGFAILAFLLGIVGLYSVVAYSVTQRTREIGVRIALGAERTAVYQLILSEAGWLAAGGISVGAAGSLVSGMLARSMLFHVSYWDAETLVSAAALLGATALAASFVPARRATRINPMEALRTE